MSRYRRWSLSHGLGADGTSASVNVNCRWYKTSVRGTHSVGADPLGSVQVAFADLACEFLHGAGARHHPEWIDPLREARICRHGLDIGGDPLAAGARLY